MKNILSTNTDKLYKNEASIKFGEKSASYLIITAMFLAMVIIITGCSVLQEVESIKKECPKRELKADHTNV